MVPTKISARQVELTDEVSELIQTEADHLEKFYSRVVDCEVHLEGPGNHHQKGGVYRVVLRIGVPGPDLHITQENEPTLEGAVRSAFASGKRAVEGFSQKLREHVRADRHKREIGAT